MMKKLAESLGLLGVILGIITALYVVYHESFEEKNPVVGVSLVNSNHPTLISKVDGLSANYKFKGRNVKNLWVEDLRISNDGNVTLVGKGSQKNIIDDSLCFYIKKPFKFLGQIQATGNLGDGKCWISNDTIVSVKFIQWRPKEYIDFRLYIEGDTSGAVGPSFYMNDRQIMNGIVKYESYSVKNNGELMVKDVVGNQSLITFFGAVAAVMSLAYLVLCPFFILDLSKTFFRYKKWYRLNYEDYSIKINCLVDEGKLKKFVEPSELPMYYWNLIEMEKINSTIDNYKDFLGVTSLLIFIACAAVGGILWTVPKFW